jgi:hypothetical protein
MVRLVESIDRSWDLHSENYFYTGYCLSRVAHQEYSMGTPYQSGLPFQETPRAYLQSRARQCQQACRIQALERRL